MLENSFISQFWNVIKINIETNHIYTQREQRARVKIWRAFKQTQQQQQKWKQKYKHSQWNEHGDAKIE